MDNIDIEKFRRSSSLKEKIILEFLSVDDLEYFIKKYYNKVNVDTWRELFIGANKSGDIYNHGDTTGFCIAHNKGYETFSYCNKGCFLKNERYSGSEYIIYSRFDGDITLRDGTICFISGSNIINKSNNTFVDSLDNYNGAKHKNLRKLDIIEEV